MGECGTPYIKGCQSEPEPEKKYPKSTAKNDKDENPHVLMEINNPVLKRTCLCFLDLLICLYDTTLPMF